MFETTNQTRSLAFMWRYPKSGTPFFIHFLFGCSMKYTIRSKAYVYQWIDMDWFKGKSTGNHGFYNRNIGFPVVCPVNQSNDKS